MNIAEVCVYDARVGTIHYLTEVGQAGNFWDTPRTVKSLQYFAVQFHFISGYVSNSTAYSTSEPNRMLKFYLF